jgi:hypothetical protein
MQLVCEGKLSRISAKGRRAFFDLMGLS